MIYLENTRLAAPFITRTHECIPATLPHEYPVPDGLGYVMDS